MGGELEKLSYSGGMMTGNTLYVRFDDKAKAVLQPYNAAGKIEVGWDYEWIVNGKQEVLNAIGAELEAAIPWASYHTIEDGRIVWHGGEGSDGNGSAI